MLNIRWAVSFVSGDARNKRKAVNGKSTHMQAFEAVLHRRQRGSAIG